MIRRPTITTLFPYTTLFRSLLGAQTPADKIAANGQLDGALGRLLLIVENYPQLKSNENFLRLQDELAGTENRIAVERKRSEEHTSELQSHVNLVCRLLLEKK